MGLPRDRSAAWTRDAAEGADGLGVGGQDVLRRVRSSLAWRLVRPTPTGVVGRNGVGKSALLKLVAGTQQSRSESVRASGRAGVLNRAFRSERTRTSVTSSASARAGDASMR